MHQLRAPVRAPVSAPARAAVRGHTYLDSGNCEEGQEGGQVLQRVLVATLHAVERVPALVIGAVVLGGIQICKGQRGGEGAGGGGEFLVSSPRRLTHVWVSNFLGLGVLVVLSRFLG